MEFLSSLTAIDTARLADWDIIARLILQAVLFTASAFFSSSETALFSLSQADLQRLSRQRHPKSDTIRGLLDEPRELIISLLCGNELINIAASVNLAGILLVLYGSPETAGLANMVIMVPLLLLFGEITPKTIAVSNPVKLATTITATPLAAWVRLVAPLRFVVRQAAERVTNLIVGKDKHEANLLGVDEFRSLLSDVEKEGVMSASERALIDNLIEQGQTEIREIMTPRPRIKFISDKRTVPEALELFRQYRHDRVPVYHGHRDTVIGFLHSEDMVELCHSGKDLEALSIADIVHPPIVVPPTKKVDEMFGFFREHAARAAIVVSEFGGVDGFLSMDDLIRFTFDDLTEIAPTDDEFHQIDVTTYEVSGLLKLDWFNDETNWGLTDRHMTTIGGYVFRHLDRLPSEGETLTIEGRTFTILTMNGNLIEKLRVSAAKNPQTEPEDV